MFPDVRHFEHVLSLYLSHGSPDFDQVWVSRTVTWQNSNILQIGRFDFLKMALAQRDHPNSMKFGVQTLIFIPSMVTLQILQIQRADGRQLEDFLAISPKIIVWLTPNLVRSRITHRRRSRDQILDNSRWRMTAILKMVLSLSASHRSADFGTIWYAYAWFDSDGHVTKT